MTKQGEKQLTDDEPSPPGLRLHRADSPVSDATESDTATKNPLSGLTPGRMVHLVWFDKTHLPAIVIAADEFGVCELFVMAGARGAGYSSIEPFSGSGSVPNIPFDASGAQINTWHWIERVE